MPGYKYIHARLHTEQESATLF